MWLFLFEVSRFAFALYCFVFVLNNWKMEDGDARLKEIIQYSIGEMVNWEILLFLPQQDLNRKKSNFAFLIHRCSVDKAGRKRDSHVFRGKG